MISALLLFAALTRCSNAYVLSPHTHYQQHPQRRFIPCPLYYMDDLYDQDVASAVALPSIHQVSSDSFTDQTYYASTLVSELLDKESPELLQDLMTAQLSHRDGIRGFFAVYLARESPDEIPLILTKAMKGVDMEKLAPLACRNVIQPAVMACWHCDPVLKENSSKTAERAKTFLRSIQGSMNVMKNIEAVYAVASGSSRGARSENKLELFWEAVFQEGGYDQEQRKAIAAAFASFVHP